MAKYKCTIGLTAENHKFFSEQFLSPEDYINGLINKERYLLRDKPKTTALAKNIPIYDDLIEALKEKILKKLTDEEKKILGLL